MGYLGYAILFFLLIGTAMLLLGSCSFGEAKDDVRELKITIPESLDYDGIFDDLFAKYTRSAVLDRVKTTNMGSLYELTYRVELDGGAIPKAFLDELRCRNGQPDHPLRPGLHQPGRAVTHKRRVFIMKQNRLIAALGGCSSAPPHFGGVCAEPRANIILFAFRFPL